MNTVIQIENIGKKYTIAHQQTERYRSLRDTLAMQASGLLNPRTRKTFPTKEEFWALQNVSFSVTAGDRIGIIGRNGAGKSTLLKILSRITEPTTGRIRLKGRVASLLEVGTGFHQELTGRENVFLNGAIMGMSRIDIQKRFDEIVAFAEVEKFLDTPVKRYSSGMYVRLAFAVAAHLEPEILIVDEVLAVGDAEFQRKCLGRMEKVGTEGRTVLFVSHNMGAIKQLCTRGVLLEKGQASQFESVEELITSYHTHTTSLESDSQPIELSQHKMRLDNFALGELPFSSQPETFPGQPLTFSLDYQCADERSYDLCLSFSVKSKRDGALLIYSHNHLESIRHQTGKSGSVSATFTVPPLSPGVYSVELQTWLDGNLCVSNQEIGEFTILPGPAFSSNLTMDSFPSLIMASSKWHFGAKK